MASDELISNIVLLTNMTTMKKMSDELERDFKEECNKYGDVMNTIVYVMPNAGKEDQVRLFVEFCDLESAYKARKGMNKLTYEGRSVRASFYDADLFYSYKFDAKV